MSSGKGPEVRYTFPPLERRGVVLGLRAGPLAALVAGAVVALVALRALHGGAGVVAALVLLVGAVGAACWPVGGQPPVSWVPTIFVWLQRRRAQPSLDSEPATGFGPAAGTLRVSPSVGASGGGGRRPSPTAPAGIRLRAAPAIPGEVELGVVEDLVARSWAAVIPVRGASLSLLAADDQARRLGSWGTALAGAARPGSAIRRLQWVEQCTPADPVPLQRSAMAATGPESARTSYRRAVDSEAPGLLEHRASLVVSVRIAGALRLRQDAPAPLNEALRREVRLLRAQMRAADLDVGEALDPPGLSAALRAAGDPTRPARPAGSGGPAAPPVAAWASAIDEGWGSVRVDGAWQATYWVAEWPRLAVGPDVLSPLLLGGAARTVAVTMAPVQGDRAVREVQSARTAAMADDALRSRAGFIDTVQRRREAEGVRRREGELADGHADYRYSGYVTVSGATSGLLAEACAEVEQAARQSHLVLRRLFGRQAEARTWTLPIGRGLS